MPLNYEILNKFGSTEDRLREILEARTAVEGGETDERRQDCQMRQKLEHSIQCRIAEGVAFNLKNASLMAAADLAWDSSPINRDHIPLVLYAQNRISDDAFGEFCDSTGAKDRYAIKDAEGKVTGYRRPKVAPVIEMNLIRSVITRRVAAQMARFNNLWPFFKFDSRSSKPEAKLQADALSQRTDVMADQFGYRRLQEQVTRSIMLYAHATIFPRCKWQRDIEYSFDGDNVAEEFKTEDDQQKLQTVVKREGVPWVLPHPTRVFHDQCHPLSSINHDIGCKWFGYWDVCRYKDIADGHHFFNRGAVGYGDLSQNFHSAEITPYWRQYFTTLAGPEGAGTTKKTSQNDRTVTGTLYSSDTRDSSVFLTHFFMEVVPIEIGWGQYPLPVWVHFTVAGDMGTVIGAEVMPDIPGVHFSLNESDLRLKNLSMAHDLMPHQDTINTLLTQLIDAVKQDLMSVFMLNSDVWPSTEDAKKAHKQFVDQITASDFYAKPLLLEGSFSKLRDQLGDAALTADNIFKVVRASPNQALENIFKSISLCMSNAERMVALSPQEQGQMAQRETSATEVTVVATTTENVYSYISDAVDEGRAALKRYLYNAIVSCSTDEIRVSVAERYSTDVAKRAGFKFENDDTGANLPGTVAHRGTIVGTRKHLIQEYVFSSRDGAERTSNLQAAQSLNQLLQIVMNSPAAAVLTRGKFAEMINESARLSGAGVNLNIQFPAGEEDLPLASPQAGPSPAGSPPSLPDVQPVAGM